MAGSAWPGPLAELLRESVDDEQVERLRSAVEARRRARRRPDRRRPLRLAAVVAAAVVVAVVAVSLMTSAPGGAGARGPLRLSDGGVLTRLSNDDASREPRRVDLDDGSSIDLAPGALIAPVANDGQRLALRLERGRATFEVEPSAARRWQIDAGLATVEVVGTVFTVSRSSEAVSVSVARGRVRVRGEAVEGGEQLLAMGDTVELRAPALATTAAVDPGQEVPRPVASEVAAEATPGGPARGPSGWRRSARDGDWAAAYEELGSCGLRSEVDQADTVAELLVLADVARRSGHPSEAVGPLERATEEFSGDRRAAVAAFTLGLLEEDQLHRQARAIRAFRRCLELGPPTALREDAWGRLAEAYGRAGRYEEAREAAREYLRRYPEGSRAEALRRWITPR